MPRYHNINGVRVQFTAEEETARDNEEAAYASGELNRSLDRLRMQRNQKLAETDWTQNADVSNSTKTKWTSYRQSLRDLPASSTPKLGTDNLLDMTSVTWPTKPS